MSSQSLPNWLLAYQTRVENQLASCLEQQQPATLMQAMRYASLDGGKRIRAVLVYATAHLLGLTQENLDPAAVAIECIHAYSLIHDDLPAMDDDQLRRGKPTCHIAFDEATAILAGDALQASAFEILSRGDDGRSAEQALRQIHILAKASGAQGMVGGQAIDLAATGKSLTLEQLKTMHAMKTGALIDASVAMATALLPTPNSPVSTALSTFSACLGLAFQIKDDILDVEGDSESLGKQQGSDMSQGKVTYVSLLGLETAKQQANQLHKEAIQQLERVHLEIGADPSQLIWLADYVITRKY